MGLRIGLRDGEKIVVNGAMLRSVGRTELRVESKAAILRGKDIMEPHQATTPARKLYLHTMMAYIDPEQREVHQSRLIDAVQEVTRMLGTEQARETLMHFARHAAGMAYYRALGECRALISLEDELLAVTAVAAA